MGSLCAPKTKTTTTSTAPPDYIDALNREIAGRAGALSQQDYQPYEGQRLADITSDEQAAYEQVRGLQNYGQDAIGGAISQAQGLAGFSPQTITAQSLPEADIQSYINPYTENVLDRARSRAFEADDIARQGRNARAIEAGAFGDNSRRFVQEAAAQSDLQDRLLDLEARELASAYQSGVDAFGRDANRQLSADQYNQAAGLTAHRQNLDVAQAIPQITGQGLEQGLAGAAALQDIGLGQRQHAQTGLDIGYQDYLAAQAHPYQQLGFATDVLGGLNTGSVSTASKPAPSPFQQLAGLGITAAGLYGTGGGFSPAGFSLNTLFGGPK